MESPLSNHRPSSSSSSSSSSSPPQRFPVIDSSRNGDYHTDHNTRRVHGGSDNHECEEEGKEAKASSHSPGLVGTGCHPGSPLYCYPYHEKSQHQQLHPHSGATVVNDTRTTNTAGSHGYNGRGFDGTKPEQATNLDEEEEEETATDLDAALPMDATNLTTGGTILMMPYAGSSSSDIGSDEGEGALMMEDRSWDESTEPNKDQDCSSTLLVGTTGTGRTTGPESIIHTSTMIIPGTTVTSTPIPTTTYLPNPVASSDHRNHPTTTTAAGKIILTPKSPITATGTTTNNKKEKTNNETDILPPAAAAAAAIATGYVIANTQEGNGQANMPTERDHYIVTDDDWNHRQQGHSQNIRVVATPQMLVQEVEHSETVKGFTMVNDEEDNVESETELWCSEQLRQHHFRQPSMIMEEDSVTMEQDETDPMRLLRLAEAAAQSQLPFPAASSSSSSPSLVVMTSSPTTTSSPITTKMIMIPTSERVMAEEGTVPETIEALERSHPVDKLLHQLGFTRSPVTSITTTTTTISGGKGMTMALPSSPNRSTHIQNPVVASPIKSTAGAVSSYRGEDSAKPHPLSNGDSLSSSSGNSLSPAASVSKGSFTPHYRFTLWYASLSARLLSDHYVPFSAATWLGFWAMLHVTCANHIISPMRDAIALQVGVDHMPQLTLASTVLAFGSSVPIGWLFEAPDPNRRLLWKRMGLTRGETQGTSLALFYRAFAFLLISYAIGFACIDWVTHWYDPASTGQSAIGAAATTTTTPIAESVSWWTLPRTWWIGMAGKVLYVAFFLVVHMMKLHSISLMWGVTTEAMDYEEVARKQLHIPAFNTKSRLQRMALVSFGGTLGGIIGSILASSLAQILRLPGLLFVSACIIEIAAELSIELGRVMQQHWEEQLLFQSTNDLASLDSSMKRSSSMGSMKRVSSGNSLSQTRSATDLSNNRIKTSDRSGSDISESPVANDDTFFQRLLRGATTILRSRLLMAIFTYNALYASTTVLLSFQRAVLVANRSAVTSVQADTAFLANINMASSVAIFALQASGLGAHVASLCGPRGTLSLMPLIRLAGVLSLAWWHRTSQGQPPNLLVFLVVDECCKIMNLAVAKPVRESLWRGLSNEARYEAKPIVDTLANRWGGGSAAFMVSFIHRTLAWLDLSNDSNGSKSSNEGARDIFGFPPLLVLCVVIATWWVVVSADLGQIRSNIDKELKKRQ